MKYIGYVPVSAFVLYTIKSLIIAPSLYEILALVVTGVLTAFFYYKENQKIIDVHQEELKKLNLEIVQIKEALEKVRTSVSGIKMGQTFRSQGSK